MQYYACKTEKVPIYTAERNELNIDQIKIEKKFNKFNLYWVQ